jgi:hypothetical protein
VQGILVYWYQDKGWNSAFEAHDIARNDSRQAKQVISWQVISWMTEMAQACKTGYVDEEERCVRPQHTLTKDTYSRGAGRIPTKMPCPTGMRDDGTSCWLDSYGRGGGYGGVGAKRRCEDRHGQDACEKWGAMWYPKCGRDYKPVGCCVCQPRDGPGIRVTLMSRQTCATGHERSGALCYPQCRPGYRPVGCCLCRAECPPGYQDQGLKCHRPQDEYDKPRPQRAMAAGSNANDETDDVTIVDHRIKLAAPQQVDSNAAVSEGLLHYRGLIHMPSIDGMYGRAVAVMRRTTSWARTLWLHCQSVHARAFLSLALLALLATGVAIVMLLLSPAPWSVLRISFSTVSRSLRAAAHSVMGRTPAVDALVVLPRSGLGRDDLRIFLLTRWALLVLVVAGLSWSYSTLRSWGHARL